MVFHPWRDSSCGHIVDSLLSISEAYHTHNTLKRKNTSNYRAPRGDKDGISTQTTTTRSVKQKQNNKKKQKRFALHTQQRKQKREREHSAEEARERNAPSRGTRKNARRKGRKFCSQFAEEENFDRWIARFHRFCDYARRSHRSSPSPIFSVIEIANLRKDRKNRNFDYLDHK